MFNLHQRCGYSDSSFARIHSFHTAGSGNGLEGMEVVCPPKLNLRKRHVFLTEKYFEDARQDEKHVPNLLEAIVQPPGPVKDELRQKLFKITQFGSKIKKNESFKILDSGISKFSHRRPMPAFSLVSFKQ